MGIQVERYVLGPIGVNTYLAWDAETKTAFLLDPGDYDGRITTHIRDLGLNLAYIILTHGHGDHIGGVAGFHGDFPDAKIVAGNRERELLADGDLNGSSDMFGRPITVEADLWMQDKATLPLGNETLTFLFTPGHTKGGQCLYVGGLLFSGDTLFRRSVGRTDFYGGDLGTLLGSIKQVLFLLPEETPVLPGHMGTTTIGEEKRENPFV